MNESIELVKKIFKEDERTKIRTKMSSNSNQTSKLSQHRYPKTIQDISLLEASSPHDYSPALVILINQLLGRFMNIIYKQNYLDQIFSHRHILENDVQVILLQNQVSRIYKFSKNSKINPDKLRNFRTSEMWELMQAEMIGLLRAQLQSYKKRKREFSGEDNSFVC